MTFKINVKRIALAGALAIGGVTLAGTLNTTPVAAATASDPFNDEWGITNTRTLMYIDKMNTYNQNMIKYGYHTGDVFKMTDEGTEHRNGTMEDIVKIFRIDNETGNLIRLKTIMPNIKYAPSGQTFSTWETTITDVYPGAEYIAIQKINGHFFYSHNFNINQ